MIEEVTIIGSGVIGSQIAQVIADNGIEVILKIRKQRGPYRYIKENDPYKLINKNLSKAMGKGIISNERMLSIMSNIKWTTSMESAVSDADLVIEAVPENLGVKRDVFSKVSMIAKPGAILATCTSSLSIGQIAQATRWPTLVIGLHFFNPAYAMKLVEVIPSDYTPDKIVGDAVAFVERLGKVPIVVKDSPGFIVNRMLMLMINEAARLVEEGVAPPEDIDKAMKLGANHPMGPLALADLIGIDTCFDILCVLRDDISDERYAPCELIREKLYQKKLGRKTGEGFYQHDQQKL